MDIKVVTLLLCLCCLSLREVDHGHKGSDDAALFCVV